MRVIPASDINRALHGANLVERLRTAFRSEHVRLSTDTLSMPSPGGATNSVTNSIAWTENRFVGIRINSTFPDNIDAGKSADMGLYVLMSGRNGDALAMIDGPALFAWSRAASIGLAASYFARPDCERLLLLGVTPALRPILRTLSATRPIANVLIWDKDPQKAAKMAAALDQEDRRVAATTDLEAAIRGAHIICQVDRHLSLDIKTAWLPSGSHFSMEAPFKTSSGIAIDSWTNVRTATDNVLDDDEAVRQTFKQMPANLFQVSRGEQPGRTGYGERTAFLQSGTGLEDLILAITVLELS